jgi:hypothetical protein
VIVVAAVPDHGSPAPGFPASLESVIAVAASDHAVSCESPLTSSGLVSWSAPGVDVLTTDRAARTYDKQAREAVGELLALTEDRQDGLPLGVHETPLLHQEGVEVVDIQARSRGQLNQGDLLRTHTLNATEGGDQLRAPLQQRTSSHRPAVERRQPSDLHPPFERVQPVPTI